MQIEKFRVLSPLGIIYGIICLSGCASLLSDVNTQHYPKASEDADIVLQLVSNIQKTAFYVDGKKVVVAKRAKILINDHPHTIVAAPEGYHSKEEYIQPPYIESSILSFTFLLGERIQNSKPILPASTVQQANTVPIIETKSYDSSTRRLALVIGNSSYQSIPLKNPVNDANAIATSLNNLGFQMMLLIDANKREMIKAINDFGKKLKSNDIGLFYFAGHGMQVNGRNYLLPIGANVESETDVEFESVDAGRLLGKMEAVENEVNIVILDACRNNPFARNFRSANRGLARMDAPTGSFIAFASAPGSVASDGEGDNGVFTKHLLLHLETPGLKIEDVMKRVRNGVIQETSKMQTPWQSSSLTGDFYFFKNE